MDIKKLWEKLNYWKKGGIIGLILGLLIGTLFYICGKYTSQEGCFLFTLFPPNLISMMFMSYFFLFLKKLGISDKFFQILIPFLFSIPYIIFGILIGLCISLIKKRK